MTVISTRKENDEAQSNTTKNTLTDDSNPGGTFLDNDINGRATSTNIVMTLNDDDDDDDDDGASDNNNDKLTNTTTSVATTLATLMAQVTKLQQQLHEELMRDEQDLMDRLRSNVNVLNAELEQEQQQQYGRIARFQNTLMACQERIQNYARQEHIQNPNEQDREVSQEAKVELNVPETREFDSGYNNNDEKDDDDETEAEDAFDTTGSVVPFGTLKHNSIRVPPPLLYHSSSSSTAFADFYANASVADDQSVGAASVGNHSAASFANNSVTSFANNSVESSTFGDDRKSVRSKVVSDKHGDQGRYTGVILKSSGLPHGMGRMVYDGGWSYDGSWCHGWWHGRGTAQFVNGDLYIGDYRFNKRHGHGKYLWADGRVYDGAFHDEIRHGKGTYTFPDGACYQGDFKNGQREGYGTNKFSGGGHYTGSWVRGRYEGFGECHWEDGRVYKGAWQAGKQHGQGVETEADGCVRHDGMWLNGKPIQD